MAKTYNQIKKSVLGKNYDINANEGRSEARRQSQINRVKPLTLSTDISTLSKTIDSTYKGWQSAETLETTKKDIIDMRLRLRRMMTMQKQSGNEDVSELAKINDSLGAVLKDWEVISSKYKGFNSADDYNKAEAMKTADIGALENEISSLEELAKEAKKRNSNVERLKGLKQTAESRSFTLKGKDFMGTEIKSAEDELNAILKDSGYNSYEELAKALGEKKVYKTNAERMQNAIKLSSAENYDEDYNKYVELGKSIPIDEMGTTTEVRAGRGRHKVKKTVNSLEKEVALAYERRQNGETSSASDTWANDKSALYDKMSDKEFNNFFYYYGKDVEDGGNRAEEYMDSIADSLNSRRGEDIAKSVEDSTWGEARFAVTSGINQWMQGYLGNFEGEEYTPTSPIQYASGEVRENVEEDYGKFARTMYDLGVTGANQLPSILVSTVLGAATGGAYAAGTMGAKVMSGISKGAGLLTMGASARGNAYTEMINLGYDKDQANTYANLVSASEMGLQALLGGISKLGGTSAKISKLVSGIDNGLARFAIQYPLAMASEATEEGLQEILTPLFKNIAAGYDTGARVDWGEVAYSALLGGLMGGMFEGPGLAINSVTEHYQNKALGQDIKANERVSDVFALADNPEIASAYEAYNRYANKGITADNVSDVKLGRLANMTKAEAQEILGSKTSTEEQKASAQKVLDDLGVYTQFNPSAKTGSAKNVKSDFYEDFNEKNIEVKDEDGNTKMVSSLDLLVEEALESDEGTEAYKIATEIKTKMDKGKKVSSNEIASLVDANESAIKAEERNDIASQIIEKGGNEEVADLVARKMRGETLTTEESAKIMESKIATDVVMENTNTENTTPEVIEVAKNMDNKAEGELFLALYDGETDVEAYTNAFNLAVTKSKDNFTLADVLKSKSVLSNRQVNAIYDELRIKPDKMKRFEYQKLSEKTANLKVYKGAVDDSVIDYTNKSTDANEYRVSPKGKVNWNSLPEEKRKSIVFFKGLAKAMGLRLELTTNGEAEGFNGEFSIGRNTIKLDIFAEAELIDKETFDKIKVDTLFPTMSHELTHWMELKSPELYRKICDIIFPTLEKRDGLSESERIAKEIRSMLADEYKGKPIPADVLKEALNDSKRIKVARSEIVARACEDMLAQSKVGKEMFNSLTEKEKKTLIEKIKDIIKDFLNWIEEALGFYESTSYEAGILRDFQEEAKKISALWDEMLTDSVEVNQALEKSGAFDLSNNVEVTKDLIAVHNASESQIAEALNRGHFIMPSLAVTNKSHTAFGDISIVFGKETINPENNKANKLYGADAWTPTQTTLKINPKFDSSATEKVVKNIKQTIGNNWSQVFDVSSLQFEEAIAEAQGSIYNAYSENIGMQTAYAMETGLIEGLPMENGRVDISALKETLEENFNKDATWRAYKKWLGKMSDTIIKSYDEASTQEIFNNMKIQPDSAKIFNLSENGELTVPATEYHSINEMRNNKGRLSENADADAKAVAKEFLSWAKSISSSTDASVKNIVKAINSSFNNRYDVQGIANSFKANGISITKENAKSLQELYKKSVELPTQYFEAKPQRLVDFNEVAYVVMPNNTSTEVKAMLDERGIQYKEYESGNVDSRIDVLNSIQDVRFSKRESIDSIGERNLASLSKAVNTDGDSLFQYRAIVEDKDIYRAMLLKHKDAIGITNKQINELFTTIDKAVDIISENLEALDYAWDVDINDRAFSPVKPNSDSLYKVSLDFSTLCRKRLLQQAIQRTLQNALDKNLSTEESIAIRDELLKIQEEGRKIEVACALCYVESARMKSPKQINKFLNTREAVIREFFANRSGGSIKEKIANAEMKARKKLAKDNPDGYYGKNDVKLDVLTAPKSHLKKADADYIRNEGKKAKASYKLTEHEQDELDAALKMGVDDFTSAKGLESLAKNHPDLFDAYTSFVRNATHSKGIENDTWWRAGDSDSIGDSLIAQMNEENGLRSQSWSDFQVIHLLDYVAATIELSTKGAKRQSYTKVPDYVKLLGNTGDMINMSLIPERVFNGKLTYDSVEGMAYEIAKQLRDEYHATVGTICIGINNEQIKLLLEDATIDMVIPYHHSSMSKATRKLMHIPAWETYQNYQGEKKLDDTDAKAQAKKYGVKLNKDNSYQKAPKFSEWFNLEEARQIAKMENNNPSNPEAYKKYGKMYGGYMAMQNAANKYLKLCAERGLAPKFSNEKADFTQDANYWKLLIDRKMVDNVTGEIIEQKAIKPIFNEKSILEILNDELARYPQVKADQEYAERMVVQKFLSGDMKVDKSTLDAIKKSIDNVTEVNILESAREDDVLYSKRDYSYETLVSKPDMKLTVLGDNVPSNRADIVDYAIKNAKSVGFTNENGNAVVHVDDVSSDVIVPKRSIVHGLDRRLSTQAPVLVKIGEVLKNSIRVNELNPRSENIKNTYALIGAAIDNNNDIYVASFIVNRFSNEVAEINVLYSANAKKESAAFLPKFTDESATPTDSAISIAELLDYVNKYFPDILPESVLRHYGYDARPDGRLGESALFSKRNITSPYDIMGEAERIENENAKLNVDAGNLKTILGTEEIANRKFLNIANYLKKISGSSMDSAILGKMIKTAYTSMQSSDALTWESIDTQTRKIAESVMTNDTGVSSDYFKRVMFEIRKDKISLSEEQRARMEERFGNYGNFHKYVFGRVNVTKDGVPLEKAWGTWAKKYPSLFDANVSGAEQIDALVEAVDALKATSSIMGEYEHQEAIRHLSTEIYNQFWNIATDSSTVENAESYRKEHKAMMEELRKDYENRQKDLVAHPVGETTLKYESLLRKVKETKRKEIARAKEHGREMLEGYKENAERKSKIQSITSNALSLNEYLLKNSKDKHIPEIMREPVTALLQAIDFSSKRLLEGGEATQKDISLSKALGKVKDMMVKATNAHDELVELYGHGLDEDIEKMVDNVDTIMRQIGDNEFVINRMSLADLQTLDKMVKTIRHAVNKLNSFHTVNHAKGLVHLSQESMTYLNSLGKGKIHDGLRGKAEKLLNWNNALPYYAFKRFGSGGIKVYEALQDGWDKFAFNTKQILDYANEAYTSKEVKEWSEDVRTFKILIPADEDTMASADYVPQYQEVQFTIPQIMSMYCLYKREQARGHLFKGGVRVADFKDAKGNIVSQSEGIIFTEKDISTIFGALTGRQKAVADRLQEFMNTVTTDWGNEVSMARFGYKAFGEENYFPIQSDDNNLAVNDATEQVNSLFRLLNMSFTKSTVEKANNRIVISDIFDVFAQHTSDMAKYNALALPVLDAFKWYNYTEKQDIAEGTFKTKSVKQSLENAFGRDGKSYFTTFLKDINGQKEVSRDTLGKGFFTNAKIASVGMNLRVVLLQPTSYVRASAVIDNKYLTQALGHKPKIAKAEEHCGIALWKSMGYYDTNIQRGVESQIKHADTLKDKAVEWSMKGAEMADKLTWGYLWNACELEIRDTRRDLKVGSKEFYEAIGKRLREVIYATQVVDSTMTRSQMMRSSDGYDKMLTSFASEPTLSYNMLQDAYMEFSLDARRTSRKEAWKKHRGRMGRILYAYTMTNAVAALVESAFDAFREDDDEEMDMIAFMKLYFKNFALDMSIGNKIPYAKELYSLLQGFSSSRLDTQWAQYLYSALNAKKPSKRFSSYTRLISQLSGLPFYNVYRDTMAALNKLDLFTEEDFNEMFGDVED